MPELPEVETLVRDLQASHLVNNEIAEVRVFWPRSISGNVQDFCSQIAHQTITQISRKGKYIIFSLNEQTLLIHLRMTGKFILSPKDETIFSHERVQLRFRDGRVLHYLDQRKFGRWQLLRNPEDKLDKLGLEPFSKEFTLAALTKLLKGHSKRIKVFLLDQSYIAGIGNIYADEVLWSAKIHPLRLTNTLEPKEIQTLYRAIPDVLQKGIAHTSPQLGSNQANYYSVASRRANPEHGLSVFRRDGLECSRCHTKIEKITIAQRSTHFCPYCQKKSEVRNSE